MTDLMIKITYRDDLEETEVVDGCDIAPDWPVGKIIKMTKEEIEGLYE